MKLILLPGMDGTGLLFERFIASLPSGIEAVPISYPGDKQLSYGRLEELVRSQLPTDEPYILLAESFSGPLAASLAASPPPNFRGVIFVATFLNSPRPWLLSVARMLPLTLLFAIPPPQFVLNSCMLRTDQSDEFQHRLQEVLQAVGPAVFAQRLRAIAQLKFFATPVDLPALYLQAREDLLVPETAVEPFKQHFRRLQVCSISGPHLLLQAKPQEAADEISRFVESL